MKRFAGVVLLLALVLCPARAAVITLQHLEPTQFQTNLPIVKYLAVWTNELGQIHPAQVNDGVTVTNFTHYGALVLPDKVTLLTVGTNVLNMATNSAWLLYSPTNDAAQVVLSLTAGAFQGQLAFIQSQNSDGAFTLPDLSEQDDVPGAFVDISGDWIATTNRGILLRYAAPDWVEASRADPSSTNGPFPSGTGATINPTDNFVPVRTSATTFGDSPWYMIRTNSLGFVSTNFFITVNPTNVNLSIGTDAMPNNTDSFGHNVVIGPLSGGSKTTGYRNVFLGFNTGNANDGNANTFIGYGTGANSSTFNNGTAVGDSALANATAAGDAFGLSVLNQNTGNGNAGFGSSSLFQNTSGAFNSAFGFFTGNSNRLGSHSVYFGANAGQAVTNGYNTFLGSQTGTLADGSIVTFSNVVVIGFNVQPVANNTTVIGNTNTVSAHIIASGYTGTGTNFLSDDGTYKAASGSVLWSESGGTISPDPAANVSTGTGTLSIGSLTNTFKANGTSLLYTNGTTSSSAYLQTQTAVAANSIASFGTSSAANAAIVSDTGRTITLSPNNASVTYTFGSGNVTPSGNGTLDLGGQANQWQDLFLARNLAWNGITNSLFDTWGTGSPEGVTTARPGSIFRDALNGDIYKKGTGTGNTGWEELVGTFTATATLNFGSILAAASEDLTITVTGAAVGDSVTLGLPAAPDATTTFNGFVSAANTITVRCFNVGTIAVDPASATYRATVNHY